MDRKRVLKALMAGLFILAVLSNPVHADGGTIEKDPQVWVQLAEDEQVAIVRLGKANTVQVDLFVSLRDASGEPHEIKFFIPLGLHPTAFDVIEQSSADFQAAHINELDDRLSTAARHKRMLRQDVLSSLEPGTFLAHGAWLISFALANLFIVEPIFEEIGDALALDANEVAPVAAFRTEHSLVELYEVESDTNLDALTATAGLQPAVQETLRRLAGQQIAAINIHTLPDGYLGLRLAWTTQLVPSDNRDKGQTYAYPLGTGGAWARPIRLTSVYIVAPPDVDFDVSYPRLGENRSGYVYKKDGFRVADPAMPDRVADLWPRILLNTESPGHAVDQALGDFGRVWRATFVQSNAHEDIVITRVQGLRLKTRILLLRLNIQRWIRRYTWAVSLLVAFVIWVTVWRFIMSRQLGFSYRWRHPKLWRRAAGWALGYLAFNLPLILIWRDPEATRWSSVFGWLFSLLLLISVGTVNVVLFAYVARRRHAIPPRKAAHAYGLAVIVTNLAYGLFSAVYVTLAGWL